MRTELFFRNLIAGSGNMILNSLLQIILRWFFVKTLGAEYLGLNGLFASIFAMLSLVDLGIGGVIGFNLYAPLAQNDHAKVAALVRFYRKTYVLLAIIVLVLGLTLMPFLSFFITSSQSIAYLKLLYFITLLSTVSGYFFSYNQILLNADQRGYIATKISMVFGLLNSLFLIITLLVTRNYFAYLIVSMILSLILQFIIYKKVRNIYGYIYKFNNYEISREELLSIKSNVKGMFYHRIGDFCVNSTDNLIIAKFVNLVSVGYFSNYFMMLSIASRFVDTLFNSMVAGFGHLFTEDGGNERANKLFTGLNFFCFWLYGFISIGFFCMASPLISLFFGDKFILSPAVVGLLALNFYITGMRIPPHIVKSAAGVFVQDKYIPIIQAVVNLVVSIVAVQYWGMLGVFGGTLVSSILPSIFRPYMACKYGLKCSSKPYFLSYIKYMMIYLTLGFLCYSCCALILPDAGWLPFLGRFVIYFVLFNVPIFLFFRKAVEAELIKSNIDQLWSFIRRNTNVAKRIS